MNAAERKRVNRNLRGAIGTTMAAEAVVIRLGDAWWGGVVIGVLFMLTGLVPAVRDARRGDGPA